MLSAFQRALAARTIPLVFALAFPCLAVPAAAEEIHVKIDNFVFVPDTVTIKPGDTVTWENVDDIPHSLVSKTPGAFRSHPLDTNDTFSFVFATAGAFDYFCGLHPHMQGKVIVAP